ncbi:hypothetical protein SAMN05216191_1261, partial [Paenibacillus jilunlii]
ERFAERVVPGFGMDTVKKELSKLFDERYSMAEPQAAK